ncbi:ankyrin [Choiromyces venosus 120613-1]|uniref:Ankyrin n=1 Tax=Choiromyces venosus 120613-1 TaxID=1336337 RepID=A0A3N4JAG8_9PEZI|nr:ankyrin [Choiromyces venosus 120613-1]
MSLNHLPNELILLISNHLPTPALNALLRTSYRFASALTPSLHKRALINGDRSSALYWGVSKCHIPMVRIILNTGTPVDELVFQYESVLRSAICHEDLTILQLLLDAGANTEAAPQQSRRCGTKKKDTPLEFCSIFGRVDAARLLLAAGARERERALKSAAKRGLIEMVKLLLDHNVTINPSPLCVAAKCGEEELLKYLIPGVGEEELNFAMMEAINYGHTNLLRILLDSGADPNYKFTRGSFEETALIQLFKPLYHERPHMPMKSRFDIAEMLISRGADATFSPSSTSSAFHWACLSGPMATKVSDPPDRIIPESAYKLLDLFLSAGMDINSLGVYGDTPVSLAVEHLSHDHQNPIDYLEYFISRGADVNTVNNSGITPLHKVVGIRKDVFVRLIELGADLSVLYPAWNMPMMDVVYWGELWPDVLQWYLQRRRDGLGFNGISETALLNASRNAGLRGKLKVSKVLLAGVNPG